MRKLLMCCMLFSLGVVLHAGEEEVMVETVEAENLLVNGSFETPGKDELRAAGWDSAAYLPAIRTQEKAFSGKYSMKITGDGKNYFGLRQIIPGSKLQGKKKLEVSACFYNAADLKGHLIPIYFIVSADGKQFWPAGRPRKGSDPKEKWFKAGTTLDLSKYTNIRLVEVFVLGWKYGNNFFSGSVYVDDFEAFAE